MLNMYKKFFFLMLITSMYTHASAPASSEAQVIKGHLYITKGNLCYVGDPESYNNKELKNITDDQGKSIELKPQDVLVPVAMKQDNGRSLNISPQEYCVPRELPLSMIGNMKEGDPVTFHLKSENAAKTIFLSLICKQANDQNPSDTFSQRLDSYKSAFAKFPNNDLGDREKLLKEGILIPNPAYVAPPANENQMVAILREFSSQEPKFLHGPNGFKLSVSKQ